MRTKQNQGKTQAVMALLEAHPEGLTYQEMFLMLPSWNKENLRKMLYWIKKKKGMVRKEGEKWFAVKWDDEKPQYKEWDLDKKFPFSPNDSLPTQPKQPTENTYSLEQLGKAILVTIAARNRTIDELHEGIHRAAREFKEVLEENTRLKKDIITLQLRVNELNQQVGKGEKKLTLKEIHDYRESLPK